MRFTQLFILLCCLAMSQTALADKVYLEYNPSCMDIYEYHYNGNTSGKGHIVYHIALNEIEKVILEVGVEALLNQPNKPSKTINCDDFAISERMVRQINSGATQLYIVKKDGRGYNVSPVGIASYAQINGKSTGYSTLDTRFAFDFNQPANDINIATNASEAKVVFKGVDSSTCPKSYRFEKTRERGGRSYASYVIVPEIGIIEEKNGFNETDAQNSVLKLVKVNGKPYQEFITTYCNNDKSGTNEAFYTNEKFKARGQLIAKDKITTVTELESGKPAKDNTTTNPNSTTPTTTTEAPKCSVYKDVDKGIYMDWNTGLPANTTCGGNTYINGFRQGEIADPAIVTTPTSNNTSTSGKEEPPYTPPTSTKTNSNCNDVSTYGKHVVQKEETLYGISRLYGLTLAQIRSYNPGLNGTTIYPCMTINTKPASKNSVDVTADYKQQQHTVKSGETLYQLASKYGYTVERFRAFNGLSPNDVLYPGQILKTSDCNCPTTSSDKGMANNFVPKEYDAASERINTSPQPEAKRNFHVVSEDDTIYSISKKYDIPVEKLRKINDLEENEIIIPYQRIYLQ
jgi:LysM repeat protein